MGNANQTWGMDIVLTGERLRQLRREHHFSQDALVDHLWMMDVQISKNSVSSWETGKKRPSVDHLLALRDLYGCTLDELVVSRQRSRDTDDRDQLVPLILHNYQKVSICSYICSPFFYVTQWFNDYWVFIVYDICTKQQWRIMKINISDEVLFLEEAFDVLNEVYLPKVLDEHSCNKGCTRRLHGV